MQLTELNKYHQVLEKDSATKRCDRNRKRSKRRATLCPIHQCYLDSASQKYPIYADKPELLQQRGVSRKNALLLVATRTAVPLDGEWLEAFWCQCCQDTKWYHVRKCDRIYHLSPAAPDLWQQATGVVSLQGNPSVGEFTRRQSRCHGNIALKDFHFMG